MQSNVTKSDIIKGLTELGLHSGAKIMVHSSLSSFGHVDGGADTVIEALMELLTEEGTLLMPSFNHNRIYDADGIFDILSTETTNGIIPDTFWRREGVLRSINPTHSFAAWGKYAKEYTCNHHLTDTFGEDSPLGLLYKDDGVCLLLGVDYKANTFHHYVETMLGSPCITKRGEVYPMRLANGSIENIHTWGWRGERCPINDEALYATHIQEHHRKILIGKSEITLYDLRKGYEVIAKVLQEGMGDYPPCSQCAIRPRLCKWTV